MKQAKFVFAFLFASIAWCSNFDCALADICSSVIPGAQMGPSPNFNQWPWTNACYISWPGTDSRDYSRNPRLEYERQCKATPGFLHFEGDFGSNHNTCIFAAPSSDSAGPAPDPDREAKREHDRDLEREYRRKYNDLLARIAIIYPSYNINMMANLASKAAGEANHATDQLSEYEAGSLRVIMREENCLSERLQNLERPEQKVDEDEEASWCKGIPISDILAKTNRITDLWAKAKRAAPGKKFVSISFAVGNSSYYAASETHETLEQARDDSAAACERMRENTSPDMTGDRTSHPCDVHFWTYNGCVMTATTPDDKSIVTASMNQGSPQADQENALATCRAISQSTLCRSGPSVCTSR